LAFPEPNMALDFQSLVEKIYSRSRHDRDIDHAPPI
jgi:hypothetical protein